MAIKNTTTHYGSVSKLLHWLIFFLILGLILSGFFGHDIADKPLKGQVYSWHKLIGLSILLLMIARVTWTLINPKPKLPDDTPKWAVAAEHSVHGVLYLSLLAMPLVGWFMSTAANRMPTIFGWKPMMPWVPFYKPWAKIASSVHTFIAWAIIAFVAIHVLAALKHHFIDKDTILRRMLPFKSTP